MDEYHTRPMETILVVDDNPIVLKMCATILSRAGYAVIATSNGRDAIERCAKGDVHISLALLDVVMPGMTGPELAEYLRPLGLKSLLMSGYLRDQSIEWIGCPNVPNIHLQKPFTPLELLRAVRQALDAPKTRIAGRAD